jgi:hypothetical protein
MCHEPLQEVRTFKIVYNMGTIFGFVSALWGITESIGLVIGLLFSIMIVLFQLMVMIIFVIVIIVAICLFGAFLWEKMKSPEDIDYTETFTALVQNQYVKLLVEPYEVDNLAPKVGKKLSFKITAFTKEHSKEFLPSEKEEEEHQDEFFKRVNDFLHEKGINTKLRDHK